MTEPPDITARSSGRPAVLIANPKAGGGCLHLLEKAVRRFETRDIPIELRLTGRRGDAWRWARGLARRGDGLVVVAGGDGTVNEAINGVARSETALGILPVGSYNVFAPEAGVPCRVEPACDLIARRAIERVPLGRIDLDVECADLIDGGPTIKGYYFLMMAGVGFDADVTRRVSLPLKDVIGGAAYVVSGLAALPRFNPPPLEVELDDGERIPARHVVVSNIRSYAGRFQLAPDADLRAPELVASLFQGAGRLDMARYAAAVVTGRHRRLSDFVTRRVHRLTIHVPRGEAHAQVDGDWVGRAPARVSVVRDALRLCLPPPEGSAAPVAS